MHGSAASPCSVRQPHAWLPRILRRERSPRDPPTEGSDRPSGRHGVCLQAKPAKTKKISEGYQLGCPIQRSLDQSLFPAPQSLSQGITSFIASCCLGIHQTPFSRLIANPEEKCLGVSCRRHDARSAPALGRFVGVAEATPPRGSSTTKAVPAKRILSRSASFSQDRARRPKGPPHTIQSVIFDLERLFLIRTPKGHRLAPHQADLGCCHTRARHHRGTSRGKANHTYRHERDDIPHLGHHPKTSRFFSIYTMSIIQRAGCEITPARAISYPVI